MKFLICGIGSIGQRHYRNLASLGHELAVFRHSDRTTDFIQRFLSGQSEAGAPVKIYYDFNEALNAFAPDAVFITNPNSSHMDLALSAAEYGANLFIEKPLTNAMDGVDRLKRLVEEKSLKVMVGYNLRWHPQLAHMRELFQAGKIGRVLSAHVEMGENMEDWHPWEDYRDTYAPYKAGGGGAVLCFSHDIDYLYWFMGYPVRVFAVGGKITPLEGDAEDMVKVIFEYGDRSIASLHVDYWQRPHKRTFELLGTEGSLKWDYEARLLTYVSHSRDSEPEVHSLDPEFERNDMFLREVGDFIESISSGKETSIPLNEGIDVLRISLEITNQLVLP